LFIISDSIANQLSRFNIRLTPFLGKQLRVNGVMSSKKEQLCYELLKRTYPGLQHQVSIPETRKTVDFYLPAQKLIIEFLGDFYHGNLSKFERDAVNPVVKKTYGELHEHTFRRFAVLKGLGYKIKYVWEADFDRVTKRACDMLEGALMDFEVLEDI
jgi:G:T-mismatch repair DNA endonuclease (very short patch repair protein)